MTEGLQLILTALGNAIISSIWQTGLLWLGVLLYTRVHKQAVPAQVSAISFAALVTGFAAFVATFIISLVTPQPNAGLLQWITNAVLLQNMTMYLALAYVLLLLIPVIRLAKGVLNVYQLKRKGLGKVPGHLKIFLLDASQYLGIKRKVKIFTSGIIKSPLTIGFLKPVILLPVALMNQLSLRETEAIILHELAHIKRNDYLQNIVTQIILTILYFNPFAKMLAKMQGLEREKSADSWVMQFEYNNCTYADMLLLLARQNMDSTASLAIPVSGKSSSLLERVECLFGAGSRRFPPLKSIVISCILILAVGMASLLEKKSLLYLPAHHTIAFSSPAVSQQYILNYTTDDVEPDTNNTDITPAQQVIPYPVQETPVNNTQEEKTNNIENDIDAPQSGLHPVFVSNIDVVVPALQENEEKTVQEAVNNTKKIVIAFGWKAIDNSLAETITSEDKQVLKEAYHQKMEAATDWEKQANTLRLQYDNINWEKAGKALSTIIGEMEIDSIYHQYNEAAHSLSSYKKELEEAHKTAEAKAVKGLLEQYKTALQKIDSLRHKKIVEL
ncbi:MAG: M56 family metallopeptidase [Niabella sp.]